MGKIDLSEADPNFRKEITQQPGCEKIAACFTCRTCVASCPITAIDKRFNPVKIIRMALYGLKEQVLKSDFIWLCSSCYACQERCPQGVCITDFITIIKNMAVKEGNEPVGIRAQRDIIKSEGRIYPLDDFDNKKRGKVGLPPIPTQCTIVNRLWPN